jgi:large subunit ribosomal protein L6
MSRVAKAPISIPSGVEVQIENGTARVKGKNGSLEFVLPKGAEVQIENGEATIVATGRTRNLAIAGTAWAILANLVTGVSEGFERKLELVGVGYRAQAQGNKLNLSLGFSHPIAYEMPEGVSVETPSQTEILLKGASKQQVGQVAAEIRAFRPPEPYKGKGVRYSDEQVIRKEAKKK